MKHALIALALTALPAAAQTDWLNTKLEFRSDFTCRALDGNVTDKGFQGQYLNLKINGKINDHFSYNYRQRFSKDMLRDGGFLNATDFLYLCYRPNDRWNITAGKQFVWIGGYEYDKAPIDVYQYSEYCQFIQCYGYGVSVDYNITPHDNLLVQAVQSAFAGHATDCYSYNAKWTGQHGWFTALYSLGFHKYNDFYNGYINCVGLGNRFDLGKAYILADFTNRYDMTYDGGKFLGDFTAQGEIHYQPVQELNVFGHYCHTHNEDNLNDPTVKPGTSINTVGAGIEYFPMKGDPDVRLHAAYFYNFGKNGNPEGVILDNQQYLTIGLTFRVDVKKLRDRFSTTHPTR